MEKKNRAKEHETILVDADVIRARCPYCGEDNEIGPDVGENGEDVCEHFVDYSRDGFTFSKKGNKE